MVQICYSMQYTLLRHLTEFWMRFK